MKHILFVCTGNTCRSPMAEAILKNKQIDGLEVKSAGIFAANGSGASPHAKQVLNENNIPHTHQSTYLNETVVDWADLILTMTTAHKFAILQAYDHAATKVFTLKEFSGEPSSLDVLDPYGGDLTDYQQTFTELNILIEKALEKLTS
jgi:protein-tyrosine-phosphatase